MRTVGIPWYARKGYDAFRQAMADADKLPESHTYWLSSAESVEAALASSGLEVVRVPLDLASFLAWCEERALVPDAGARSRYATEAAAALSTSGN